MSRYQDDTAPSSRTPDEPLQANPLSRATYALGSILSVGLVIGLGVWGYKLLVRDVSGVPVIRAAEGPMRIQPEDPGGRQTLNQGLSVNDVAAVGTAGAAPDQLILAPAPLDLSDEDAAGTVAPPAERTAESSSPDTPEPAQDLQPEDVPAPEGDPDMVALAEAISEGITPLEDLPETPADAAGQAAVTDEDAELPMEDETAIASSLRPKARPADLSNIREVAAVGPTAQDVRDVDPETIPVGTRLAQLGAFSSGDKGSVKDRLEEMYELFPILKSRSNQTAETMSGGEQQMCAIARGLMSRPKLIMLDELSLGLQPSLVERVFEAVTEIRRRGVTILLVEQMVQEALEIADRGYVLQTGRVVQEGTAQELLDSDEVRKAYMGI